MKYFSCSHGYLQLSSVNAFYAVGVPSFDGIATIFQHTNLDDSDNTKRIFSFSLVRFLHAFILQHCSEFFVN